MRLDLFKGLRDRGWKGTAFVHVMGWFGDGHTYPMTTYKSNDPLVVSKQIDMMKDCGVGGIILTWQGVTVNKFLHQTAIEMSQQCSERHMQFALLLDPWICKTAVVGQTKEQVIAASLNDPTVQKILNAPSYIAEKYVLDFGTGASLQTLATMFPKLQFVGQNTGFAWPPIQMAVNNVVTMNNWLSQRFPCFCLKFDDAGAPSAASVDGNLARGDNAGKDNNTSVWSAEGTNDARRIEAQAGLLALTMENSIPVQSKYAAFVTWNDYNERTEIESFIAMVTNTQL